MSSSNCCFLTCIQISQEAGQVVWYDLIQIPYDYTVEVTNRFKGLDLIDREICMQVRKQQLELDMEQQTGSKQEKEYVTLLI